MQIVVAATPDKHRISPPKNITGKKRITYNIPPLSITSLVLHTTHNNNKLNININNTTYYIKVHNWTFGVCVESD